MKASEVFEYLKSLNGGWVDYADTVDFWRAGDPEAQVRGVAVGWMSYTWALEMAASLGCNLFITHEPTFYEHQHDTPDVLDWPEARAKKRKIDELGLTILRCHDLWDQYPGLGIPDSWGKRLGLGDAIGGKGYYRVYDGGARTVGQIAREVARRVRDLGQEEIQVIGAEEKRVKRIVVGTGAITPFREMLMEHRADLAICADDGFSYWRDGGYAVDNDKAVIVVNHCVAEDHGLELLAGRLGERFPAVPVRYIKQTCVYRLVK